MQIDRRARVVGALAACPHRIAHLSRALSACAAVRGHYSCRWVDQMYMLEKTAGEPLAITFYLVLVIVGSNFIVNLFLAVLFDKFTEQQEQVGKVEAYDAKYGEGAPAPGDAPIQLRRPSTSKFAQQVESWVYVLIALNTLSMCANYEGESELYKASLDTCNIFFTCAFFCEMVFKLCTYGRAYFGLGWNRFDFFIVGE